VGEAPPCPSVRVTPRAPDRAAGASPCQRDPSTRRGSGAAPCERLERRAAPPPHERSTVRAARRRLAPPPRRHTAGDG
jgi:hypothetical protein